MRILLAAGASSDIDINQNLREILQKDNLQIVGDCYSAEVLADVACKVNADTVIVSILLGDQDDLLKAIKILRERGNRVIVLPGDIEHQETRSFLAKLIPYGIYDFVFDEVDPKKLIYRLRNPATLGDVPKLFREITLSEHKYEPLNIEDELNNKNVILTEATSNEQILNLIRKNKKALVIIDAEKGSLANMIGIDPSTQWQHDWRIGLAAAPVKVNRKTELYTIPYEREDIEWEERDFRALKDIVNAAVSQKKKVIILAAEDVISQLRTERFLIFRG